MAAYSLESSNVYSYVFPNPGLGNGNYLTLSDANNNIVGNGFQSLNLNSTPYTVEFWANHVGNFSDARIVIASRIGSTATSPYTFAYGSSGEVTYYTGTSYNTGDSTVANSWSHIAFVNNLTSVNVFIDGVNVYNTTALNAIGTAWNPSATYTIGGLFGGAEAFRGQISNLRVIKGQAIYSGNFNISTVPVQLPNNAIGPATGSNVAASLTGNVVLLTCASEKLEDLGNTGYKILSYGTVIPRAIPTQELESFSYYFGRPNSNGTCLVTSASTSLNLNTTFTVETWIYPIAPGGTILNRGGGPNAAFASYWVGWDGPNLNFAASSTNTNYDIGSTTGTAGYIGTPTLNAWNHVAITRSGNNYLGFLNGNLNLTITTANVPYAPLVAKSLTIGGDFQNGQTWATGIPANTINGFISNFRILRGTAQYTAAFTPPRSSLKLTPNTVVFTAASPGDDTIGSATGNYEDLSRIVTISSNGTSTILWSNFSPFRANSVVNANSRTVSTSSITIGSRNIKIIDKVDYTKFAATFVHNYTIGNRLGKIIDKVDYTKFANPAITSYTSGNRLGKIISNFSSPIKFAYIPTNTKNYDPTQYQFWS
jgi:hypothetical protein